ncbi:MAG: DUF4892 domain-containing protein [Pseudomonadales bacterium]|nr:DUF4892 domain-containing protein [Pseudomonadales bacterium]
MRRIALVWLVLLLGAAGHGVAEVDQAGSRDPLGIERFPRAWIVDYQREESVQTREFVMGRVERLRRDIRVQEVLRVDAARESATYRIPDGVAVTEVAAHYRQVLEGGVLFRCGGRDCGRSNEWANQVFGKAILYGPDGNQHYIAWEWQGRLISVYVIERGNRRVYAHLQVLEPADAAALGAHALLARRLLGQGWAVIDGVVPDVGGALPEPARAALVAAARELAAVDAHTVYLVCHVHGPGAPEALLAAAGRCAQAAVEALSAAGLPAGMTLVPFAAGPLLPRGTVATSRIELVVPDRLSGQQPTAATP